MPTALPSTVPDTNSTGSGTVPVTHPHHGMSLKDILDWIAYLIAKTFSDGGKIEKGGNSGNWDKRSHARDIARK